MTVQAPGPLTGVTVVSLAEQYPGPFATMVLADLGAEVTMVERPTGDPTRRHAALFRALNRNKRSVALDLKSPSGRAALRSMLADADVLLEGFRPGVMRRLGFSPAQLRREFPDLVVVSISSYGQTGPDHELGSHDLTVQGRAGMLDEGGVGSLPTADLVAGAFAAIGALTGLVARGTRGGSHIDVAMLDCLVTWQAVRMTGLLTADDTTGYPPAEPAYGVFRCGDGRAVTLAIAGEDRQWAAACEVLGLEHLAGMTTEERERRTDELRAAVERAIARWSAHALIERLERRGVSCGHVRSLADVLEEPQVQARGLVVELASGRRAVRQPLLVDGEAIVSCPDAPALGQDNARYGLRAAPPTPV